MAVPITRAWSVIPAFMVVVAATGAATAVVAVAPAAGSAADVMGATLYRINAIVLIKPTNADIRTQLRL
ncbi:MAG: hypothetical protein ABGZ24_10280 [Fuerstiella sp.]